MLEATLCTHPPHLAKEGEEVVLPFDKRYCRRSLMTSTQDRQFLLKLSHTTLLQEGDILELTDGTFIRVIAALEDMLAISSSEPHALLALAWSIGNRHCPLEITDTTLRVRYDPLIEQHAQSLSLTIERYEGPFTPTLPQGGSHAPAHS